MCVHKCGVWLCIQEYIMYSWKLGGLKYTTTDACSPVQAGGHAWLSEPLQWRQLAGSGAHQVA